MKTTDVMERFMWGDKKGKASGGRLYIEGDKLINYGTTIAQRIDGRIVVNKSKYSATTTRHQNYLLRSMPEAETVDGVHMGCYDLKGFLIDWKGV